MFSYNKEMSKRNFEFKTADGKKKIKMVKDGKRYIQLVKLGEIEDKNYYEYKTLKGVSRWIDVRKQKNIITLEKYNKRVKETNKQEKKKKQEINKKGFSTKIGSKLKKREKKTVEGKDQKHNVERQEKKEILNRLLEKGMKTKKKIDDFTLQQLQKLDIHFDKWKKKQNMKIGLIVSIQYIRTDEKSLLIKDKEQKIYTKVFDVFSIIKKNIKTGVDDLVERYFNSIGGLGSSYYKELKDKREIKIAKPQTLYNVMTVPLKKGNITKLKYYNKKGELVLDNIESKTDTCVIDLLMDEYVDKYRTSKKSFPIKTREKLIEELKNIWIQKYLESNENNKKLYESCEPIGQPTGYDPILHGVSLYQLEKFCNKYKLPLRCLDSSLKYFYCNMNEENDEQITNKNYKALMVIIDEGHIYQVKDNEMRRQIQNTGNRNVRLSMIKEKKDNNIETQIDKNRKVIEVNNLYENFDELLEKNENTVFILTNSIEQIERFVADKLYYKEKFKHRVIGNIVTEVHLDKKNSILYNDNYKQCKEFYKMINVPFFNQNLNAIGKLLMNNINPNIYDKIRSVFTPNLWNFCLSINRGNYVRKYKTEHITEENKHLFKAYDIIKCYTSILLEKNIKYIKINGFSNIEEYKGEEIKDNALYYVDEMANNNLLIDKKGVYYPALIKRALKDGLIKRENIKYVLNCETIDIPEFKNFVDVLYHIFKENPDTENFKTMKDRNKFIKQVINRFVGMLGKKYDVNGNKFITCDINTATTKFFNNKSFVHRKELDYGKHYYVVNNAHKCECINHTFLIHGQIVQLGRLKVYDLYSKIKDYGELIEIKTDCVVIKPNSVPKLKLTRRIGGYREESLKEREIKKDVIDKFEPEINFLQKYSFQEIPIVDEWNTNDIIKQIEETKTNILIEAPAGTGKTYLLNKLKEYYKEKGKSHQSATFTNPCSLLTASKTLHKLFGFDICGRTSVVSFKGDEIILIDEVSQMPSMFFYEVLSIRRIYPNIRFLLFGDLMQTKPVKEEFLDYKNSEMLKTICQSRIRFNIDKRGEEKLFKIQRKLEDNYYNGTYKSTKCEIMNNFNKIEEKDVYKNLKKVNISFTNKMCRIVNRLCMKKFKGEEFKKISQPVNHRKIVQPEHTKLAFHSQVLCLYKDLPLRCRKSEMKVVDVKGKTCKIYNGMRFIVEKFDDKNVYLKCSYHPETLIIPVCDKFCYYFNPAYCGTIHSYQGQAINEPFCMFEVEDYDAHLLYTAITRSTKLEYIFYKH